MKQTFIQKKYIFTSIPVFLAFFFITLTDFVNLKKTSPL